MDRISVNSDEDLDDACTAMRLATALARPVDRRRVTHPSGARHLHLTHRPAHARLAVQPTRVQRDVRTSAIQGLHRSVPGARSQPRSARRAPAIRHTISVTPSTDNCATQGRGALRVSLLFQEKSRPSGRHVRLRTSSNGQRSQTARQEQQPPHQPFDLQRCRRQDR